MKATNQSYLEFLVAGDPTAARAATADVLAAQGFRLTWQDDWTATGERGSETANYLLGGMVKYLKIGVRFMSAQPGETVVQIEPESSGHYAGGSAWVGQAIGNRQMANELSTLRDELGERFSNAGILRGIREG